MTRAEDVVQGMYEDSRLRESMTDDEANTLFQWAEGEIVRLDATYVDDEPFYTAVDTLFDMLAGIDGLLGVRAVDSTSTTLSAQTVRKNFAPQLEKIARRAGSAGYGINAEQLGEWAAAHHLDDNLTALATLTASLSAASGVKVIVPTVSPAPFKRNERKQPNNISVNPLPTEAPSPNIFKDNAPLEFTASEFNARETVPNAPTLLSRPKLVNKGKRSALPLSGGTKAEGKRAPGAPKGGSQKSNPFDEDAPSYDDLRADSE